MKSFREKRKAVSRVLWVLLISAAVIPFVCVWTLFVGGPEAVSSTELAIRTLLTIPPIVWLGLGLGVCIVFIVLLARELR